MAEEEKPWWQQLGEAASEIADGARKAAGAAAEQAQRAAGEALDAARNTDAGRAIEGVVGEGQRRVEETRKGIEGAVTEGTNRARAAGSAAVAAITGEEPARKLTKSEIIEVQKAFGIDADGGVGKGTRGTVTEFAKENSLDPASIITPDGKGLIGTPEFLGTLEAKTGVDLSFFKPTPGVQQRISEGLDAAGERLQQVGKDSLGWIEQKAREACALTDNVNPDGSCKTPAFTPDAPKPMNMGRQN